MYRYSDKTATRIPKHPAPRFECPKHNQDGWAAELVLHTYLLQMPLPLHVLQQQLLWPVRSGGRGDRGWVVVALIPAAVVASAAAAASVAAGLVVVASAAAVSSAVLNFAVMAFAAPVAAQIAAASFGAFLDYWLCCPVRLALVLALFPKPRGHAVLIVAQQHGHCLTGKQQQQQQLHQSLRQPACLIFALQHGPCLLEKQQQQQQQEGILLPACLIVAQQHGLWLLGRQ